MFELPVWTTVEQWLRMGLLSSVFFIAPAWLEPIFGGEVGWLHVAALYCTLSVPCLWLGYNSRLADRLSKWRPLSRVVSDKPIVKIRLGAVFALYLIVILCRLYLIRIGAYGYLGTDETREQVLNYLQLFHLLEFAGAMVPVILLIHRNRFARDTGGLFVGTFVLVLLVEIGFRFIFGNKGAIAYIFLALAITDYRLRGRLYLYLPVGILVLCIMFPINILYRQQINMGNVDRTDLLHVAQTFSGLARDALSSPSGIVESAASGLAGIAHQSAQLQNFAAILLYVEETETHVWGTDWIKVPAILLIPRAIWPDKPQMHFDGRWMTQEVMGKRNLTTTATALPMQGDFYLNFGLPSLLIGMFLIGILQRVLYNRYGSGVDPRAVLYYPFILLFVGPAMTVQGIVGLVRLLVFLFLVNKLIFVRSRA